MTHVALANTDAQSTLAYLREKPNIVSVTGRTDATAFSSSLSAMPFPYLSRTLRRRLNDCPPSDVERFRTDATAMACEIVETERALLAVWGTPQIDDVDLLIERLRFRVAATKTPVFYVTRVPSEAPAPTLDVRNCIKRRLPALVECCASYHVILEGDGFAAAMKRAVLLSLFQLAQKRGLFHVHPTLEVFRQKIPFEWRSEITRLLELAATRDLLRGVIPSERKGSGSFAIDDEPASVHSNSRAT